MMDGRFRALFLDLDRPCIEASERTAARVQLASKGVRQLKEAVVDARILLRCVAVGNVVKAIFCTDGLGRRAIQFDSRPKIEGKIK